MENFDIAKYLKEHSLGSYGMFNGYVDIKPLKEAVVDPKITIKQINPITFSVQVDWKYGLSTVTAKTAEEAERIKARLEQAFAAGEIEHPSQLSQYAHEDKISEEENEIPYKGPEPKLAGDGTEFKQTETVSEEMEGDPDYSRIMELGGEQIEQGIISLMDDGLENIDILELCKEFIKAHMEARRAGHRF